MYNLTHKKLIHFFSLDKSKFCSQLESRDSDMRKNDLHITYSNDQTVPYWVPKCVLNLNGARSLLVTSESKKP